MNFNYCSSLVLRVLANDEPHGVFSLNPEQQSVVLVESGSEVSRVLVMNVTRLAGLFGNASVGYRISGGIDEVMDIGVILGGLAEGRLLIREGQAFSSVIVPISSQVRTMMLSDTVNEDKPFLLHSVYLSVFKH